MFPCWVCELPIPRKGPFLLPDKGGHGNLNQQTWPIPLSSIHLVHSYPFCPVAFSNNFPLIKPCLKMSRFNHGGGGGELSFVSLGKLCHVKHIFNECVCSPLVNQSTTLIPTSFLVISVPMKRILKFFWFFNFLLSKCMFLCHSSA